MATLILWLFVVGWVFVSTKLIESMNYLIEDTEKLALELLKLKAKLASLEANKEALMKQKTDKEDA